MLPLRNAIELSCQAFSAMNRRLFSIEASSPSRKHIHGSFYANAVMFLSQK